MAGKHLSVPQPNGNADNGVSGSIAGAAVEVDTKRSAEKPLKPIAVAW